MRNYNARNERIKRAYFIHMKEAMRFSDQSVDAIAAALHRFEVFIKLLDFKEFKTRWAIDFKAHMAGLVNLRTKEKLSKATLLSTMNALKAFFQWLSREPGYKSRIAFRDADYFNLGRSDTTLGHFGERFCQTPEEFKALSQNIAHNGVLTTLVNYGTVSNERQAEIIRGLGKPKPSSMRATLELSAEEVANVLEARDSRSRAPSTQSS